MNLITGIIVAVVGLILIALGLTKIVPGVIQTGFVLVLLGLLIVGLSFIPKPVSDGDAPRMSTAETLLKIFYAPAEVFQNLRRHPRWLAALLVMSVFSAIFFNAFMYRLTPERVTNYTIDKTLEMPMIQNNEQARKQVEESRKQSIEDNKNPVLRAAQSATSFAGQVFWMAFLALVFFLFALAMGGKINYWQAFSVAVYASFPVAVVRYLLSTIILFIKDPDMIHPIIGQSSLVQDSLNFLVVPGANPVLYSFLSAFSLLAFYWLWLNGTGLKNAGERVTPTIAWTASLGIFFFGVFLSVLMGYLFGGFLG